MKRGNKGKKRVQFAAQEEAKRKQIIEQLTTNVALTRTIQEASHLLMHAECSISEQKWNFMDADKLDSLVSLLNESLFNEVLEERVLRGLCCNLAGCPRPEMSEEEINAWRAHAVRARGHSVRDMAAKLKAMKKDQNAVEEDEGAKVDPLFCSEAC